MNVLEKILEEIEEKIEKLNMADNMCRENAERNRNFEGVKYFQSLMFATERAESIIEDIIRSHMDEVNDTMIEEAAIRTNPEIWRYIVKSVTLGLSYEFIEYDNEQGKIPMCKNDFYGTRRKFFSILNEMKMEYKLTDYP